MKRGDGVGHRVGRPDQPDCVQQAAKLLHGGAAPKQKAHHIQRSQHRPARGRGRLGKAGIAGEIERRGRKAVLIHTVYKGDPIAELLADADAAAGVLEGALPGDACPGASLGHQVEGGLNGVGKIHIAAEKGFPLQGLQRYGSTHGGAFFL